MVEILVIFGNDEEPVRPVQVERVCVNAENAEMVTLSFLDVEGQAIDRDEVCFSNNT